MNGPENNVVTVKQRTFSKRGKIYRIHSYPGFINILILKGEEILKCITTEK